MSMFSIIISTCNRADSISGTLDSLLSQEMKGDCNYELIIVDNNSVDDTKEKILSYKDKFSGRLHYLLESGQGKAFALNTGIKHAKGNIIVFTDDDVILDPQWLSNIWRTFKEYDCDGVGGRILPHYPADTPDWVKDNHSFLSGPIVMYDCGEETKKYDQSDYEFLGANFAFKRQVFDECGPFRTDVGPGIFYVGEDTEFVKRVFNAGKELYYCGQALAWHPADVSRMNLSYFARWYVGLGKYRFVVDEEGAVEPSSMTMISKSLYV